MYNGVIALFNPTAIPHINLPNIPILIFATKKRRLPVIPIISVSIKTLRLPINLRIELEERAANPAPKVIAAVKYP